MDILFLNSKEISREVLECVGHIALEAERLAALSSKSLPKTFGRDRLWSRRRKIIPAGQALSFPSTIRADEISYCFITITLPSLSRYRQSTCWPE
jgi:hypothetical protein